MLSLRLARSHSRAHHPPSSAFNDALPSVALVGQVDQGVELEAAARQQVHGACANWCGGRQHRRVYVPFEDSTATHQHRPPRSQAEKGNQTVTGSAKWLSPSQWRGLRFTWSLLLHARVMITHNLCVSLGLCNGTVVRQASALAHVSSFDVPVPRCASCQPQCTDMRPEHSCGPQRRQTVCVCGTRFVFIFQLLSIIQL